MHKTTTIKDPMKADGKPLWGEKKRSSFVGQNNGKKSGNGKLTQKLATGSTQNNEKKKKTSPSRKT